MRDEVANIYLRLDLANEHGYSIHNQPPSRTKIRQAQRRRCENRGQTNSQSSLQKKDKRVRNKRAALKVTSHRL